MNISTIIGVTPFESPDVHLALALAQAKAFPVLHLGRNRQVAEQALSELGQQLSQSFGVCIVHASVADLSLPEQVTLVIAPYGMKLKLPKRVQLFYQVHSLAEAKLAKKEKADGIILKGNESGGKTGDESSYILFQQVVKAMPDAHIYVQGGIGIHTTAALIGTGATGVVLDSQLVLFPECTAPKALKNVCEKLNGNETRVIDHYRVLVRPNSPELPENATIADLEPLLQTLELDKGYLPLGQDIAISTDLVKRYKKLGRLITGMHHAISGHIRQAQTQPVISPNNALAKELNITYPIAQGPMTRVSDVPAFAAAVANAGALPFVALSLLKGESARNLIRETKQLAGDKTWGVGILGFAPQELRDEQTAYIQEEKPPFVLIAGGRPSQAKALEQQGIQSFLHVPSASLLDMFIKEGARKFVFEGRECGGHVGPLSSFVLWEKQIDRLLQEESAGQFSLFFAGGIHDALSAAFIGVMAAPLATKGAKVGVLMGTAYIYTKEAVESGAILQQFQDQAIAHNHTVLLETAPGHETRCLHSPFADYFNKEKEQLIAANVDKKEIWAKLESLNVGRLRIAAKGVDRTDAGLVKIATKQQLSEGMYMIGQVAAMRNEAVTMHALHEDVASMNQAIIDKAVLPAPLSFDQKALDVAIIGMACIYPGAKNIDEYWANILNGVDCVTEVPDDRWNKALYFDNNSNDGEMSPSKWGGFIPRIDFDPMTFGIPPQSLAAIDPTQLLALLVAKQALDNAGYGGKEYNGEDVSVIIGAEGGTDLANSYGFRSTYRQYLGEMPEELKAVLPKMTEDSFPGVLANVISGRITNRLDLGGRNYTVDAACASSLAAIDLACQELVLGKSEMVLAGAADLHNGINDYLMFSSTHALSKKGRCATFDSEADGIALGEGVAMIVLKRLSDAKRDGDKIYAVIKGVGGSSDGKSLGLTAPRKAGQVKALERAYEMSGISPANVGLVEAHGTGTVVGDKTEISAISDMLIQNGAIVGQTYLGSVKTQIGHTKCAAGLAGLIKAALSVYHGIKPATLHMKTPNSFYNPANSPFLFNAEAGVWLDDKRTAGISAFGFGGTNFHAVIENDASVQDVRTAMKTWPAELFVFRGNSQPLLKAVSSILQNNDSISLRDLAYSLAVYSQEPITLSIVASGREDLMMKLDLAMAGATSKDIYVTAPVEGKLAFLFPGQGSQRINMARELFVAFPVMRELLKKHPAYEKLLFPPAVFNNDAIQQQKEQIKDTRVAQPVLGIVDLAMAQFLQSLGIAPDMVAGHSYGELPALCFAGAFAAEQLVPLSEQRAKAILDGISDDKGMMVAVSCAEDVLKNFTGEGTGVYPVNHNSPTQWALAGKTADMEALMVRLKDAKITFKQMEVACAFHSPVIAGAKALYAEAIKDIKFESLAIPVWSNTTAQLYPTQPSAIRERLAEHIVKPVLFAEEVEQMYAAGARVFIEAGPGKVLSNLAKATLGKETVILHTEDKAPHAITHLLNTLAKYISTGRAIQLEKLFEGRDAQVLDLDNPAQYKKSATVWLVNGHMSVPTVGKLPAHGAMPLLQPLKLNIGSAPVVVAPSGNAEHMVQEYLNSVKLLVQAQRDVILGYLGHTPAAMPIAAPVAAPGPAVMPAAAPAPVAVAASVSVSTPAKKDTKRILIEVVSEKTGYPHEMLGLEMDMEADLSIDSIKRMEIIGELRTKMGGFKSSGKSEEAVVEQLAGIKTLNGLLQWIAENVDAQTLPDAGGVSLQHAIAQQPVVDIKSTILDIVSEKTGYPQEMLGLDLDMEADLSIDSIKRMEIIGELRTRLGGFNTTNQSDESVVEQLAGIKTLNGLLLWISGNMAPQQAAPSAAAAQPSETAQTWSESEIKNVLLLTVSEKTGYPTDMLGMDLDMEADLSIDSIKRMEILGELKIKIGSFSQNGEDKTEALAGIKTLNGLLRWIAENVGGATQTIPVYNTANAMAAATAASLSRLCFSLTPAGFGEAVAIKDTRFAIMDDGSELPATLQSLFSQKGATATIINGTESLDEYQGLIIPDLLTSPGRPNILTAFDTIKKLHPEKVKWVYAISGVLNGDAKDLRSVQGYPGFLKSLDKEWETTKCRSITLTGQFPADRIPGMIIDEILHPDEPAEVIYNNGSRHTYSLIPSQLPVGDTSQLQLDRNSVVLVLGGAQGITAELMIRFAKDYPCNYILVGRSADPRNTVASQYASLTTKDAIKKQLIAEGQLTKPADIEKKASDIHKANQILSTIHSLEKNGATVIYRSLDLRNEQEISNLITQVYKDYGRIDGVVHGAGLLEDKLFQQKTAESFERVYTTKVTPLRILAEQLRPDVQFVIFFSSVASAYGNRGQTDYAAANSVMDRYAWELRNTIKGKVTAINWGPWKGTGMVSPALEREYERRGIALIPLQDGMELFVNELKYGNESQVVIMA
jgi:acyl transferase domain-containing protein/NAD(P)H-dependent flavin oxidoreductase YrpB (nitropropane dioxygenase family)/NAD(P)-dependent dehydrogenase (short-subunit alcohol dehydrogenase family)